MVSVLKSYVTLFSGYHIHKIFRKPDLWTWARAQGHRDSNLSGDSTPHQQREWHQSQVNTMQLKETILHNTANKLLNMPTSKSQQADSETYGSFCFHYWQKKLQAIFSNLWVSKIKFQVSSANQEAQWMTPFPCYLETDGRWYRHMHTQNWTVIASLSYQCTLNMNILQLCRKQWQAIQLATQNLHL